MTDPPEPSLSDLDIADALVPTGGLYVAVETSELPDDAQVLAREFIEENVEELGRRLDDGWAGEFVYWDLLDVESESTGKTYRLTLRAWWASDHVDTIVEIEERTR